MGRIIYAKHMPENHEAIGRMILSERPEVHIVEFPEDLNPVYDAFVENPFMTFEELMNKSTESAGCNMREDLKSVYVASRRVCSRIIGAESAQAFQAYMPILDRVKKLKTHLGVLVPFYYTMRASMRQRPNDITGRSELHFPFEMGESDIIARAYEGAIGSLVKNERELIDAEIERERAMIETFRGLKTYDFLAYFGLAHRTLSHLLRREGIDIPSEIIGPAIMDPHVKYHMALKYEMFDFDPAELRSEDMAQDCDPSQKDRYLELMPYWFAFSFDGSGKIDEHGLIRLFWENLDDIKRSVESRE